MKFRIKSYLYLLAFCTLPGLSGCTEENTPAPVEGDPVTVQLDLRVATVRRAVTRAAEVTTNAQVAEGFRIEFTETPTALVTRSEIDESEIEHLWLLQYAASGPLEGVLLAKQEILAPGLVDGQGRVEAMLTFGDDCDLFVVANAPTLGNEPLIGNRSGFRSMLYDYTAQDEFPMVGHYRGRVPGILGTGLELERLTAKIELFVSDYTSDGITVRSAILKSVPTSSYFYNRQSLDLQNDWLTPTVSSNPLENSAAFTQLLPLVSDGSSSSPHYIWYMPENRRGTTGTTITESRHKWLGNSPTYNIDGSGTSYATHIELQIDYNDGTKEIPLTITFFPGETNQNDHMVQDNSFNMLRNCYFNISASFYYMSGEDPRIEEDGKSRVPIINNIYVDDTMLTGSGVAGAIVTITWQSGQTSTVTVDTGGVWQVIVPESLTPYENIYATQKDGEKEESNTSSKMVEEL